MRLIVQLFAICGILVVAVVLAGWLEPRPTPSSAESDAAMALASAEPALGVEIAPPVQVAVDVPPSEQVVDAPSTEHAVDIPPSELASPDAAHAAPVDEQVAAPIDQAPSDTASLPAPPSAEEAAGEQSTSAALADESCNLPLPGPLPRRGDPAAQEFWQAFRQPLAPAPRWNPPGTKRVGLQAGHWLAHQAPEELQRLEGGGTRGGGKAEWEVTLDLALRAKDMLEAAGMEVDILPATVPVRYRAHVFVSIHADGDPLGRIRGFKVARPGFSSIPDVDNQLVDAMNAAYGAATGLPRDDEHITRRMLYYYAFNSRRYCHSVAPGVPQVIIETGFLTSSADRQVLIGQPSLAARGVADGVLAFLRGR